MKAPAGRQENRVEFVHDCPLGIPAGRTAVVTLKGLLRPRKNWDLDRYNRRCTLLWMLHKGDVADPPEQPHASERATQRAHGYLL